MPTLWLSTCLFIYLSCLYGPMLQVLSTIIVTTSSKSLRSLVAGQLFMYCQILFVNLCHFEITPVRFAWLGWFTHKFWCHLFFDLILVIKEYCSGYPLLSSFVFIGACLDDSTSDIYCIPYILWNFHLKLVALHYWFFCPVLLEIHCFLSFPLKLRSSINFLSKMHSIGAANVTSNIPTWISGR